MRLLNLFSYSVILYIIHISTAAHFSLSYVTASAESVGGSTPGARVIWSTNVPLQCVTSVRVNFRASSRGPVVATYTTTNTSENEIIQTGLQCSTYYYISVVVTGKASGGIHPTVNSRQVQLLVGGKETVCMHGSMKL